MDAKLAHAGPKAIALAVLYAYESLLLELEARQVLFARDVEGMLSDAANSLAALGEAGGPDYQTAGEIIEAIRERHERLRGETVYGDRQ